MLARDDDDGDASSSSAPAHAKREPPGPRAPLSNKKKHNHSTKRTQHTTTPQKTNKADEADLVALLCLQPAMAGGESRWCSSAAVYNEVAAARPDLLPLLFEDWYW